MSNDLGRALLANDAVSADALAQALYTSVTQKVSLVRALIASNAIGYARLDEEIARLTPDHPVLKHPIPVAELLDRLPPRLCESLFALPVRRDPRTGTVDVALADPNDAHAAQEIAYFLGAEVRPVRAPVAALEVALARMRSVLKMRAAAMGVEPPPSPMWDARPSQRPATISDRPLPLLNAISSNGALAYDAFGDDEPIPLSRPISPPPPPPPEIEDEDDDLVLSLGAAKDDFDDEPVVELRHRSERAMNAVRPDEAPSSVAPAASSSPPPLRDMARATSRDPLMESVLAAASVVATRIALFAVKKDAFAGWMCTSDFGDRGALATVRIATAAPSFLAAAAGAGHFVGPLVRNDVHAPLARFFRASSPDVLALAIRAAGRPAVILVAADVADPLEAMAPLRDVARVAGESLERILVASRNGAPSKR